MPRVRVVDKTQEEEELELVEQPVEGQEEEKEGGGFQVRMVEPKPRLVKVKFLVDHEMTIAGTKYEARKGDVLQVEVHVANTLVGRGLAHLL